MAYQIIDVYEHSAVPMTTLCLITGTGHTVTVTHSDIQPPFLVSHLHINFSDIHG